MGTMHAQTYESRVPRFLGRPGWVGLGRLYAILAALDGNIEN
jgi:hypothetical protein